MLSSSNDNRSTPLIGREAFGKKEFIGVACGDTKMEGIARKPSLRRRISQKMSDNPEFSVEDLVAEENRELNEKNEAVKEEAITVSLWASLHIEYRWRR